MQTHHAPEYPVLILLAAPGDKLENGEFDCSDSLMKRQSSHRGEAHCQTEPRTAQICHYALQRRISAIAKVSVN